MRRLGSGRCLEHRLRDQHVVDQHGDVLARRPRRDGDDGIARLQHRPQLIGGARGLEIDLMARDGEDPCALRPQPVDDCAADKAARPDHDRAPRHPCSGIEMTSMSDFSRAFRRARPSV